MGSRLTLAKKNTVAGIVACMIQQLFRSSRARIRCV